MFGKSKKTDNFKFKSLQPYSWGKVIAGKKKFRKVFDRWEISYLSVELAFYNKLFDEEDWTAHITVKAYTLEKGEKTTLHCDHKKELLVKADQNITIYDFGWGDSKKGSYWEEGHYIWEAYIGDELVGTADFYIEEVGEVTEALNPYFEALSLRTYEAPKGDVSIDDRYYVKTFDIGQTRYIMGELRFSNKISKEWFCEVFFNIYDDTGQLLGSSEHMMLVTPKDGAGETFTISAGWGSSEPGLWLEDHYKMEVVFMDTVVGIIPFRVGTEFVERLSDYEALLNQDVKDQYEPNLRGAVLATPPDDSSTSTPTDETKETPDSEEQTEDETKEEEEVIIDDRPLEEILADLDSLIGLQKIKDKIREYVDYLSYLQIREEKGFEEDEEISLHAVFTGNPGTGKTTVVKLLGRIYKALGILSKGHVHTVEANDLISGYVRQSGKDTKEAIKKAKGGILFIDEAYMLFKDTGGNDFGPEAVAALLTEMSDGDGDIAIMVAGYPKEMENFLSSNPGLKSRFRNYYHFEDYTPDELVSIADFAAKKREVTLSAAARERIRKIVMDAFRKRDEKFGNARFAHALIDEAKMNLGIRLVKGGKLDQLTKRQLSEIQAEDIEDISTAIDDKILRLPIDYELLKEAQAELDALTGLEKIKQEVHDMIKLTRYYKEMNRDMLKVFSMHSVFAGNPGTGKTTVARILGKFYKALGLLERGHLKDADASDLVAGYVGQTSLKTMEVIKEAQGGILFIDEAYSMTEGHNNDFGKQAVAILIKQMEDKRKEFGLIVAGYTKNMEEFLKSNPGLKSRFDRYFHFDDFAAEELYTIAIRMFSDVELTPDKEADEHIKNYLKGLYENRDRFFGNARSVRKMVEKAYRNQELRMASLPKEKRTKKAMNTLVLEDVAEFQVQVIKQVKGLGYKYGN
jgi:SpoVK/Ycf46/Vps4 family AAA+-type ATPase